MIPITVPGVMRAMGFEVDQAEATSIGAEVREQYRSITGEAPMKVLTTKSRGTGTHCHAVYPLEFQPVIESIIKRREALQAMQRDLFTDGGEA